MGLDVFKGSYQGWEIDGSINLADRTFTFTVEEHGHPILSYTVTEPEAEHAFRCLVSLFAPAASALGAEFEKWYRAAVSKLAPPKPTGPKRHRFSDILQRIRGKRTATSARSPEAVKADMKRAANDTIAAAKRAAKGSNGAADAPPVIYVPPSGPSLAPAPVPVPKDSPKPNKKKKRKKG